VTRKNYTDHIRRHTSENICHAVDYAKWLGVPLNKYVVLNLTYRDDGAVSAAEIFKKIRHKYRDWLINLRRRNGLTEVPAAYIYSLECPDEMTHANWMLHVPRGFEEEFLRKLPQWVIRSKGALGPYDISVDEVDPKTDKRLAKYVIKGTDPTYVKYLHLEDVSAPQGRIYGRRASCSVSIGRAARDAAGFVPKRDRNAWKKRLEISQPSVSTTNVAPFHAMRRGLFPQRRPVDAPPRLILVESEPAGPN